MLQVAQELGIEGYVEKQEDEVTPAVLKVIRPVLLWHAAKKGDLVKLAKLLEEGTDPNVPDNVREGSDVVVRSWWWRERGGRSRSPAFR